MGSDQSKSRPQPQKVYQQSNYGQSVERQRNPYSYVRQELPQPVEHKLYPGLNTQSSQQATVNTRPKTTQDNATARYENARVWINNNYPGDIRHATNSFEVVENQFRVQPSTSYSVQPTAPPAPPSPTPRTSFAAHTSTSQLRPSTPQRSSTQQTSSSPQPSTSQLRPSTPQRSSTQQTSTTSQKSSATQNSSAQHRSSSQKPQSTPQRSSIQQTSLTSQQSSVQQRSSSQQRPTTPQGLSSPLTSSASQKSSTPGNRPNKPQYRNNNSNRNQNNNNDIRCETCSGIHGEKIFQCDLHHNSCETCKLNIICGRCSGSITNRRNFALEDFMTANNYKIKCPYSADGCSLMVKRNEINDHVEECPFKDLKCPITDGGCNWQGKASQLSEHFEQKHPSNQAEVDAEMVKNICSDSKTINLIKLGTYNFLFHTKVSEMERKIYMAVQLIGTKIQSSKWKYEVHIYNKREPRRKFLYTDCCKSFAESVEGIMEGKCVVLPLNYAMTFIAEGNLTFKCLIKKEFNDRNNNRGRDKR